jgi:hypothetical protein
MEESPTEQTIGVASRRYFLLPYLIRNLLTLISPGGRLQPGESEIEGLKRKLTNKLAPTINTYQPKWEVKGFNAL